MCLALSACDDGATGGVVAEEEDDEAVHARIEELLVGCGEVCDTGIQGRFCPTLSQCCT